MPLNRLWFTVYKDDDEALELWKKAGAPPSVSSRFDEKDNSGRWVIPVPAVLAAKLHYYIGDDLSEQRADMVNGPGDDCIEIWNLVFMQFNRDETKTLNPLPKPSVDTGAGLERVTAVLQVSRTTMIPI